MTRGRKRAPGGRGRQPSSYQREVDSYAKRLEVITFHDTNGMPATLDKFYDHLSAKKQENKRKRIYEWIKDRSRIESVCTSSTKASMKVLRGAGTATTISAAGEEAITEKDWQTFLANREECLPVLLLLDDFSAHWTDEVKEHAKSLSVHLMPVPPGLTSVCQQADISWFRPFKQRLRRQWVNELQQQLRAHHEQREQTPFQLVAPKRKDAITWAMSSWRSLGSRVIRSGFSGLHKVGSSAAVAVTETVEPENDLVEALELANVVEETIDDSDDIIDRLQADVE